MRKFLLGLTLGLLASAAAASAAFPAQLPSAFSSGQLLLASSLEDLRQAVNGMLGAFDASGNVAASRVATGSSFRFVTDAQKAAWDAKLDAGALGSSAASLSGGTVPLAQLPPVFDSSGLNVLASAVSTSAGARFVTDAQIAAWNSKYDSGSSIPYARISTGAAADFITSAERTSWSSKFGSSDLGVSVAPLSGGLIPAQYLPATTSDFGPSTVAYSENVAYQAQSAGIVLAIATAVSNSYTAGIAGYADASTTPNVLISSNFSASAGIIAGVASITFPVKRGDYWKVSTYGNGDTVTSLKFMPLQ